MDPRNLRLLVAYDGGAYLGWQDCKDGSSIQAELTQVIEQVLQHPIKLQAASRTDAGVHAAGQVVNFTTSRQGLCLKKLQNSLNALLPTDIRLLEVEEVPTAFHPTTLAKGKIYHYDLCLGPVQLPRLRQHSWHVPYTLDFAAMQQAAELLQGTHDFEAFCNSKKNETYESHTRHLQRLELVRIGKDRWRVEVEGNAFLYKMVRNLVGTLVFVGRGKLLAEDIPRILEDKKRSEAGMTAPAHGLTLVTVLY